jgi:hypothetical protein
VAFVSCVSSTFFQPARSGSHLYSAHRNTVRSGHRVKGLTDSRGSFPLGLPCPRLLYPYCITLQGICQGVSYIFSEFFSRAPTPVLHSQWQAFVCGYPLPLTMIVYHTPPQKSTWQSAQIRASKLFDFCTTFLLTNCWRYGIMEIPAPTSEGAAPKIEMKKATPSEWLLDYSPAGN